MSHEEPLKKIFALICGDDPLTQIFVDLLPEQFSQRIFVSGYAFINPRCFFVQPKIEDNIVRSFDKEVKDKATAQVYEAYVQITLDNFHGKTNHT